MCVKKMLKIFCYFAAVHNAMFYLQGTINNVRMIYKALDTISKSKNAILTFQKSIFQIDVFMAQNL